MFIMYDMEVGGAEHVFLNLMNEYSRRGIPISLITNRQTGFLKELSPQVRIVQHDLPKSKLNQIRSLAYLFKRLNPTIIFTTQRYFNMVASWAHLLASSRGRLVIREAASNINEELAMLQPLHRRWLAKFLFKCAYRRADRLIANSIGTQESLVRFGVVRSGEHCVAIPNPVNCARIRKLAGQPDHEELVQAGTKTICWIARFDPQKKPMEMLDAFRQLYDGDSSLRLVMFGDGPLRSSIQEAVVKNGLQSVVALPGKSKNPFYVLKHSDVFVLTSDFEGFGMVLVEALALGTPIVSADLRDGPAQTLDHGRYGRLYEPGNMAQLVALIREALNDHRPFTEGIGRAEDFEIERIADKYLKALRN